MRIFNNHLKLITSLLISNVSYGLRGKLACNFLAIPFCAGTTPALQFVSRRTLIYSSIFLLTEQLRPSLEAVAGLAFWAAEAGLGVQSNFQLYRVR